MVPRRYLAGDRLDQARNLHRDQQLGEEALFGAFEPRESRSLGLGIERFVLEPIHDIGEGEDFVEIAMNDGLSRGSGNAKERGVGAGFQGCGTKLLRIILIANLGGLWTS